MHILKLSHLWVASALLSGCGSHQRDAAPRAADTALKPTIAAVQSPVPALRSDAISRVPDRFVPSTADTFDLVSVDGVPVPLPVPPANARCPTQRLFSARYVFAPDSTYKSMTRSKIGCGDELTHADSNAQSGKYSILGDTLFGFVGDGDEEFSDFSFLVWRDSLMGGKRGNGRYVRRGSHPTPR